PPNPAATSTYSNRLYGTDPAGAQPSLKDLSATTPSLAPSVLSATTPLPPPSVLAAATKPYLTDHLSATLCHLSVAADEGSLRQHAVAKCKVLSTTRVFAADEGRTQETTSM
ncbi:unnamed protein product, partial [Urochloa humidicola]